MTSLALLGAGALVCAADDQTSFDHANTAFAQKNYGQAEADYQAIIMRQGFSAPVLFNLANAYYQDGKLGLAILNYERAQLLNPNDTDIAANLRVARAKAGLADRPTAWFEQATHFFSVNTLSWIGSAAVLFVAIGFLARQFVLRHGFGWLAWITASVCVLMATMCAVGIQWPGLSRAIVTVKNTPMYISPVTVGQPLLTLAEGQSIALRKAYGEFVLIETSGGQRGWVKREDVSQLLPVTLVAPVTYM
jgi:tetratricopeptide (TPR) repeat protein